MSGLLGSPLVIRNPPSISSLIFTFAPKRRRTRSRCRAWASGPFLSWKKPSCRSRKSPKKLTRSSQSMLFLTSFTESRLNASTPASRASLSALALFNKSLYCCSLILLSALRISRISSATLFFWASAGLAQSPNIATHPQRIIPTFRILTSSFLPKNIEARVG